MAKGSGRHYGLQLDWQQEGVEVLQALNTRGSILMKITDLKLSHIRMDLDWAF